VEHVKAVAISSHSKWREEIEQFLKVTSKWYALMVPLPKPWPDYREEGDGRGGNPKRRLERMIDGVKVVVYNLWMFNGDSERINVRVYVPGKKKGIWRRDPDKSLLKAHWDWRLVQEPNFHAVKGYSGWEWEIEDISEEVLTQLSDIAGLLEGESDQVLLAHFNSAEDAQLFLEALWAL